MGCLHLCTSIWKEANMGKKAYVVMLILALVAGAVGGALSSKIFRRQGEKPEDSELRKVIVANEIHLVDNQGKARWVLAFSRDGEPSVTFVNRDGWAPMAMGVNRNGFPFFNMILQPQKDGGPSLTLMDGRMRNRAVLGLWEDGEPYLRLLDRNGQVRATLGSTVLEDSQTGTSVRRPCSSLVLFDEKGKIIWSAPQHMVRPIQFSKTENGTTNKP
jgi:LytS/YehU family sensor histidine kinase